MISAPLACWRLLGSPLASWGLLGPAERLCLDNAVYLGSRCFVAIWKVASRYPAVPVRGYHGPRVLRDRAKPIAITQIIQFRMLTKFQGKHADFKKFKRFSKPRKTEGALETP